VSFSRVTNDRAAANAHDVGEGRHLYTGRCHRGRHLLIHVLLPHRRHAATDSPSAPGSSCLMSEGPPSERPKDIGLPTWWARLYGPIGREGHRGSEWRQLANVLSGGASYFPHRQDADTVKLGVSAQITPTEVRVNRIRDVCPIPAAITERASKSYSSKTNELSHLSSPTTSCRMPRAS